MSAPPPLTRVPTPTTHRPDRLAMTCGAAVVGHVNGHWHARHFEKGWQAALDGVSRRSSPFGSRHPLTAVWRRGYDAAQKLLSERRAAARAVAP